MEALQIKLTELVSNSLQKVNEFRCGISHDNGYSPTISKIFNLGVSSNVTTARVRLLNGNGKIYSDAGLTTEILYSNNFTITSNTLLYIVLSSADVLCIENVLKEINGFPNSSQLGVAKMFTGIINPDVFDNEIKYMTGLVAISPTTVSPFFDIKYLSDLNNLIFIQSSTATGNVLSFKNKLIERIWLTESNSISGDISNVLNTNLKAFNVLNSINFTYDLSKMGLVITGLEYWWTPLSRFTSTELNALLTIFKNSTWAGAKSLKIQGYSNASTAALITDIQNLGVTVVFTNLT